MLTPEAQLRQAIDELTRRYGGRVDYDEIREAAIAAHLGLVRISTVPAHLAVLTVRRAARELDLVAADLCVPVQRPAELLRTRPW